MLSTTLQELNTSREMVDVFKGYNHNLRIGEGEFYDMKNLTSDSYPVLSPRAKRGVYVPKGGDKTTPTDVLGVIEKDSLCYVKKTGKNAQVYIDGVEVKDFILYGTRPRTLISMGTYVIIMPDRVYINIKDVDNEGNCKDKGNIEVLWAVNGEVTFTPCRADGTEYGEIINSPTAPDITEDMKEEMKLDSSKTIAWVDTSDTPHQLKQ